MNIEYDNATDEEIDDTKEIQIEDALKLYQAALKYHAEGSGSFQKALDAYNELFQSEIFKYPESHSQLRRQELYGSELNYDDAFEDEFVSGPVQLVATGESAPNTLPQILHLAYKNHGQLVLDMLQAKVRESLGANADDLRRNARAVAKNALVYFAEALDKDDTDLDLWGRTASVAALVGSERVSRYCLEAILDDEEEGINGVLSLPGVAEGFAIHKLREEVQQLQDDLALKLQPLSRLHKKRVAKELLRRLAPYGSIRLPQASKDEALAILPAGERLYLQPVQRTWAAIGDVILRQFQGEQSGYAPQPGTAIGINAPHGQYAQEEAIEIDLEPQNMDKEPSTTNGPGAATSEVQIAQPEEQLQPEAATDVEMIESTTPPGEPNILKETDTTATEDAPEADGAASANQQLQDDAAQESRKRSSESAGLAEEEGTRTRSKRLKARESIAERTEPVENAVTEQQIAEEKLQPFTDADELAFAAVGQLFEKLGISTLSAESLDAVKAVMKTDLPSTPADGLDLTTAIKDLYAVVENSAPEVVSVLLDSTAADPLGGTSREAGLNAFLGFTKSGTGKGQPKPSLTSNASLDQWLEHVNQEWLTAPELAWMWIRYMLCQRSTDGGKTMQGSTYREYQWTDELKRTVVQLIVHLDDSVVRRCINELAELDRAVLEAQNRDESYSFTFEDEALIEMIQTLFELHLDVYSLIKQPGAGVDTTTQMQAKDRLERWSAIAHQGAQLRAGVMGEDVFNEATIRHLWATAFHLSVCDDVAQEHVILCMHQLKILLEAREGDVIELQNNAVMPELSIEAIERELSRIHMQDFFLKVFADDEKDSVATIEMLEPILELGLTARFGASQADSAAAVSAVQESVAANEDEAATDGDSPALTDSPAFKEMSKFLESSNVSLRLSLWQRLREAYEAIDYQPKVVSCYLKCIELLTFEIESSAYRTASKEQRYFMLLRWLRLIDDILVKILAKTSTISGNTVQLDCIDDAHLQSSLTALTDLLRLLHTVDLFEDSVRVGLLPPPMFEGRAKPTFAIFGGKIHDMQLRLWMLSYALLKEGMAQDVERLSNADQDKFDYLHAVHHIAGVRGYCKFSNKAFLRLLKEELLQIQTIEGSDFELSQVLYDLYGLKCWPTPTDLVEHGAASTSNEILMKKTATKAIDFVMAQAAKIPAKDLPKLELKGTIDKVHQALGKAKSNEATQANKRMVAAYLKSAIPPLELFRCLDGITSITAQSASPEDFPVAAKGWYFLMGDMALNKYLSLKQKNVSSTPIDDLNIAMAFFTQDLEFSFQRWETWYRLAKCYELQLEEAVLFSAEKINTGASELLTFQRAAIHCYTMAVATSMGIKNSSDENITTVAKMYQDFGTRIYASSRQPFSMEVFNPRETEARFFSKPDEQPAPIRGYAFWPLTEYTAWKFAAALFKRAIARTPGKWWSHYMLSKCLWKMYTATEAMRNYGRIPGTPTYRPSMQDVIDAATAAIESLPQRKDNRREKEPILEPHYKLVSIAHKLVLRKDLDAVAAADILQVSDLCSKVPKCGDPDDWERYVLQLLKALRAVDKANWHHRMTARAAHVLYDDSGNEFSAMGAKHEFTQQIFTKTMAVQVWKPENERPGRHFVYTTRYTRFFVKILCQLEDRANMDALSKRLRRKPQDFFDHGKLWQEFCTSYLKLLRGWGKIPEGHEDAVFKSLNHEDFVGRAVRLELWCQNPNTKSPLLDVLRDVIELKKVNNGLIKATLIDDLVGDTYAKMYADVGPSLDNEPLPPEVAAQLAAQREPPRPTPVQVDGAADNAPPYVAQDGPGRPRTKGVGRRELQRRAEAAVTLPVRATPALPVRSNSNTTVQVVVSSNGPPQHLAPAATGTATVESSAPGSVQDDADNESELSELDEADEPEPEEVIAVKPLFPNLRKESPTKNATSAEPVAEAQRKQAKEDDTQVGQKKEINSAQTSEAHGDA